LVILEETRYELIKDLKNMLCEDEYRYVATSLLQNICAHAKDELRHQDAGNHLSSAFPMVSLSIATKINNFGMFTICIIKVTGLKFEAYGI